jgi:dienelactone hydrolase
MKEVVASVPAWLAAATLLACGGNPVDGDGARLTLSADSVTVPVGGFASVTATTGNTGEQARFVSRDTGVATVNASGAISGVAVGSTYVVVTLPSRADVRDSVRVRVQAPDSCSVARPSFGGAASAEDRALFAYDASAPLNLTKTVESTSNGVEVSAISFGSPDGGSVTGLLFDPVGRAGPRPGIVLMHGAPGSARAMAGHGQALAAHGAVVIAIDAPFTRRGGPFLRFIEADRAEQIQLIKDLQRAVDVLRTRPNVDNQRIAYLGISYGGAVGVLFAGIERRIKAAALVVADGGPVSHSTGPEDFGFMASLSCAARANWFRVMVPIEPVRFIPHAPPTALLLQNGRMDTLVPMADAEALHAVVPEPRTIRWYDAGHGLNQQALSDRHEWLNAQIGLDLLKPPS